VAGTVETLAPPVLSFLWFPVNERATATAVMASANTLGTATGFLTALIVPNSGTNDQILNSLTSVYFVYFAVCALTFIACVVYFPDRPPTPPSFSNEVPTVDVKSGIVALLSHGRFWVVVASQAVPLGILSAFMNVLNINLKSYNLSQTDSGWIGLALALGGTIGGVVCGRVADAYPGRMARILAGLYFLASALVAVFMMILAGWIQYSLTDVIVLTSFIGFFLYGAYPLFFELALETTFADGISSSASSGFLVMAQSIVATAFLAVPVDVVGVAWMNWSLLISPAVFAVVLLMFREDYSRLHMDLKQQ
jgi:FLVCR family MFS transporter